MLRTVFVLTLLLPVVSAEQINVLGDSAELTGSGEALIGLRSLRVLSPVGAAETAQSIHIEGDAIRIESEHEDAGMVPFLRVEPQHTNQTEFSGSASLISQRSGPNRDLFMWGTEQTMAHVERGSIEFEMGTDTPDRVEGPKYMDLERPNPHANTADTLALTSKSDVVDLVVFGPVAFSLWDWDLISSHERTYWSGTRDVEGDAFEGRQSKMLFIFVDEGTVRLRLPAGSVDTLLIQGLLVNMEGQMVVMGPEEQSLMGSLNVIFDQFNDKLRAKSTDVTINSGLASGSPVPWDSAPLSSTSSLPWQGWSAALAALFVLAMVPILVVARREMRWKELTRAFEVGFYPHVVDTARAHIRGRRKENAVGMLVHATLHVRGSHDARSMLNELGAHLDEATHWYFEALLANHDGKLEESRAALARCLEIDPSFSLEVSRNTAMARLTDVSSFADGYS